MRYPDTPSTYCGRTPEPMHRPTMGSPEPQTLPSISRWLEHPGHHRSMSLPTPMGSRGVSPMCSQEPNGPYTQITPPTPPPRQLLSPFMHSKATMDDESRARSNCRANSHPPSMSSPRFFTSSPRPFPDTSADWRPAPSRSSSVSSTQSSFMLSPPTSYASSGCSIAGSDRCSVYSLLNHEADISTGL